MGCGRSARMVRKMFDGLRSRCVILAFEHLHGEVTLPGVLTDGGDGDDVRVADARRQLRFLEKSSAGGRYRREHRAQDLDREALAGVGEHALVHGAHRSDADEPFDLELA